MSEICFIELRPRAVATGAEVIVRLAGGGSETPYRRNGAHYRAGIVEMPRFRAEFGFDDNGWTGGTTPTSGALAFMPSAADLVAELSAYYWRDAPIVIEAGDEKAALALRLSGSVANIASNDGQLAIALVDPSKLLDKPLLGTGFAGTGGIEGPSEATGRPKRRSWGMVFNVEGELLDKINNIYEFGDPAHPLLSFDSLRDKGRAGATSVIAWQGSIAATFAALQASSPEQGGGIVAPSIACAKWWTTPSGPLTADLRGEVAGGYTETPVGIAAKLLFAGAGPAISDFATANALRPATCGVHIASSSGTIAQALDRLLLGISLYWVLQPDGQIRIGEWAWSAPVAALPANFLGRDRQLPPVKSRKVGYRRNHRPHQASEISAAVLLANDVTYLNGTSVQSLQPAEPGATLGARFPGLGAPVDSPHNIRDHLGALVRVDELVNSAISLAPSGELSIVRQGGIPATVLGKVRVAELGAASAASMRQADDALAQLAAAMTQASLTARDIRTTMRDATIYTDPATGRVGISAVDQVAGDVKNVSITLDAVKGEIALKASRTYVDNSIALAVLDPSQVPIFTGLETRITSAEVRLNGVDATLLTKASAVTVSALEATVTTVQTELDALDGLVSTKVATTTFNALDTRVTIAEETIEAIGDTATLTRGVSVARLVAREQEDLAAATLQGLVDGEATRRRDVAAIVSAREEITARIVDGETAEAAARLRLAADVGANKAAAEQGLLVQASALAAEVTARQALAVSSSAALTTEQQARITAINAEAATRAAAITAEATARGTALTAEETARIAAINAEATARATAIAGEAATRAAAITAEQTARIDADTAIATDLSTLTTRVGDAEAEIVEQSQSINGLSASAVRQLTVTRGQQRDQEEAAASHLAATVDLNGRTRDALAAVASAREEITARLVDGDGAEAAARRALEVRVGGAESSIVNKAAASVARDVAEATARQALQSSLTGQIGTVDARVTSEAGTRATADTAIGQRVDTVEANLATETSSRQAAVTSEATARATADTALGARVDTVEASIATETGNRTAAVTSEATARVAGDAANAAAITAVTTTVDGHTSTLTTQAESINGIRARYTLKLDVGGRVTGMAWDATSSSTSVDFIADAFRLWVPALGQARQIFEATADGITFNSNVKINGSLIVTGTVPPARLPLSDRSFEVNGANQVQIRQVTVAPPAATTIFCDQTGAPKSGQLPRVLTPVVTLGGDDIRATADVAYAIAAPGALAATVNNTGGSADKGRITIGTGWTGPGTINLTVTVDAVDYGPFPITVSRQNDPPATTGGGGGGAKQASDSSFNAIGSASFDPMSDELTVDVATGETITVTAPLDYNASALGDVSVGLVAKSQYQPVGGGSWTDFPSSPVGGTDAVWYAADFAGGPGSISINQSQSGLSAGAYKVRLVGARTVAAGSPVINVQSGTMNVVVA